MQVINDKLSVVIPDVYEVLDIGWSGKLIQTGGKKQEVNYGADGKRRVVELGENYFFYVSLEWSVITPENKNTILDLYFNSVNQMEKSFIWRGYDEEDKKSYIDYVAYFDTDLTVGIGPTMDSINEVTLSIKGKLNA